MKPEDVCPVVDHPRATLNVSLVAYECLPGLVFVRVPNERGRWMMTDRSVVEVDCPYCGSVAGEPCKSKGAFHTAMYGNAVKYTVGIHTGRKFLGKRFSREPKPKLRVRADDIAAAASTEDE